MAPLQLVTSVCPASCRWLALLPALVTLAAGCASVDANKLALNAPPVGNPTSLVTTWDPNVAQMPDTLNNGRKTAVLTGRVYLFEPATDTPVLAKDGRLQVLLYDEHPKMGADGTPVPLEIWDITPECLKLVQARDTFGWHYTLNLPWATYRPDIGKIDVQVRFAPKDMSDGMPPLYNDSMVSLQNNGPDAQYAVKPHSWTNQLMGMQIPTGYGQGMAPANRGTLDLTYPVNNQGSMVAQPQTFGANPQGVMQAQALSGQGTAQPQGTYPQGTPQGNGVAPQGQPQAIAPPPGQPQYPQGMNPPPPAVFTPNPNNRMQ